MILAYRSALFLLVLAACSPGPKGDTTDTGTTTGTPAPGTSTDDIGTTVGPITSETTSTTDHGFICDLVELTTDHAHQLGGAVVNCGIVDPMNNTAEEWQTARDCALTAAGAEQQFQLVTWLQGVDSSVGRGYVGVAARSFALEVIHFDSLVSPVAVTEPCASLAAVDGCTVAPGEACLSCVDSPGTTLLCDFG